MCSFSIKLEMYIRIKKSKSIENLKKMKLNLYLDKLLQLLQRIKFEIVVCFIFSYLMRQSSEKFYTYNLYKKQWIFFTEIGFLSLLQKNKPFLRN